MRTSTGQTEDVYNYYHSNSRIKIECAFGEFIMRWGIFWRKLQMDLASVGDIISAAGLVHNFIIDERDTESFLYISSFSHNTLIAEEHTVDHGSDEIPEALVSGNNEPKPRGRPKINDVESKKRGEQMREVIAWTLKSRGMIRPSQPGFKYNSYGMVYMET